MDFNHSIVLLCPTDCPAQQLPTSVLGWKYLCLSFLSSVEAVDGVFPPRGRLTAPANAQGTLVLHWFVVTSAEMLFQLQPPPQRAELKAETAVCSSTGTLHAFCLASAYCRQEHRLKRCLSDMEG